MKNIFSVAVVLCRSLKSEKLVKAQNLDFYAHKAPSKVKE